MDESLFFTSSAQFWDPDALLYPFNPPDALHTESFIPLHNINDPQAPLMDRLLEPKHYNTVVELDEDLDVQVTELSASTANDCTRDDRPVVVASNTTKKALKDSIQPFPASLLVRYDLPFLFS